MKLTSTSFSHNQQMDKKYTLYGENRAPHLAWHDVPTGTKSLVLIIDDPDAPTEKPWIHGLFYGIDLQIKELKEGGYQGLTSGLTDFGTTGYQGPRPPNDGKVHHYHFRLFALDAFLDLHAGIKRQELEAAMEGHVLGNAEIVGTYKAS